MEIRLSRDAEKQYHKLPRQFQIKVKKKISALRDFPYSGKKLGGDLDKYWSLRAWPYRVIYQIKIEQKIIEVSMIIHRQGAYK